MSRDIIVGLDAGTSVIKAVAFDRTGRQIGIASRPNTYAVLPGGGVEQNMDRTWEDAAAALSDLAGALDGLPGRILALAVTGQGDGCWLIDKDRRPVHDGWLWLDARAADETRRLTASPGARAIYECTATGFNACQMRTQFAHMADHLPHLLERAEAAFHCKDWLYLKLTGVVAQDTSEATYTFGDYRTRQYSDDVLAALGQASLARLLPPIVDGGTTSHGLTAEAAGATGLPEGLPVVLGYLDIMCTALGAGLHDAAAEPGLTVVGSTGMHMRFVPDASHVQLNDEQSGYTIPFPGTALAQMQTNMASTLNIDWLLGLALQILEAEGVSRTRANLLDGLDARVMGARPGAALYHPYIATAGERGPFVEPDARASFTGLDQTVGWFDIVRSVFEGLAFAARDCYAVMGPTPAEIRISGGAARSSALRAIIAAALDRPVRTVTQAEAGAAGASMIAAVQQGLYPDMAACVAEWVMPHLTPLEPPDATLARTYDALFPTYLATREALAPTWTALAAARSALPGSGT